MTAADIVRPVVRRAAIAAVAVASLTSLAPAPSEAATAIPRRAVEPSTCPIVVAPEIAGRADCGRLTVPEDRGRTGGRTVAVEFMVVAAETPDPARLPLLFVMGGNGSGLKMAQRQSRLVAALAKHDTVIFVDHRGSTPWGRPDMSCPGYPEGLDAALPDADPAQVEACRRHLDALLDINLYGPYEAAQDLRDLRLALGLPRWNVYGVSYGTTIAQRLLALDAAAIGGIVLDGMSGVESNAFSEAFLIDPLQKRLRVVIHRIPKTWMQARKQRPARSIPAIPEVVRQLGETRKTTRYTRIDFNHEGRAGFHWCPFSNRHPM